MGGDVSYPRNKGWRDLSYPREELTVAEIKRMLDKKDARNGKRKRQRGAECEKDRQPQQSMRAVEEVD